MEGWDDLPLNYPSSEIPGIRGYVPWGKIRSNRAPFAIHLSGKPRKTIRFGDIKNTHNYRFFCQNTAKMHLIKCTPKAIESRRILPYILPRLLWLLPIEARYWRRFFRGSKKQGNFGYFSQYLNLTGEGSDDQRVQILHRMGFLERGRLSLVHSDKK